MRRKALRRLKRLCELASHDTPEVGCWIGSPGGRDWLAPASRTIECCVRTEDSAGLGCGSAGLLGDSAGGPECTARTRFGNRLLPGSDRQLSYVPCLRSGKGAQGVLGNA